MKVAVQRRSTSSPKWLQRYWLQLPYLEEHDWEKAVEIGRWAGYAAQWNITRPLLIYRYAYYISASH